MMIGRYWSKVNKRTEICENTQTTRVHTVKVRFNLQNPVTDACGSCEWCVSGLGGDCWLWVVGWFDKCGSYFTWCGVADPNPFSCFPLHFHLLTQSVTLNVAALAIATLKDTNRERIHETHQIKGGKTWTRCLLVS